MRQPHQIVQHALTNQSPYRTLINWSEGADDNARDFPARGTIAISCAEFWLVHYAWPFSSRSAHRPLSFAGHIEYQENKKLCFCTASLALNSRMGEACRAKTKQFILLRLNMVADWERSILANSGYFYSGIVPNECAFRIHAFLLVIWGAGMVQWWEHSILINAARVRLPDSALYVGWVWAVFLRYSSFPLS